MSRHNLQRVFATAVGAGALLVGCGSSNNAPTSARATSSPSSTPAPSASASTSGGANQALPVALTAADLPGLTGFVQTQDGLLGDVPNTDSRVFSNTGIGSAIEIDVAVDSDAGKAGTDYQAYNSNAGKQVTTRSAASSPSIGSQANEYAGTNATGHYVVAVAFQQGSVIAVVTFIALGAPVDRATVEAIAQAQAAKISSAGL